MIVKAKRYSEKKVLQDEFNNFIVHGLKYSNGSLKYCFAMVYPDGTGSIGYDEAVNYEIIDPRLSKYWDIELIDTNSYIVRHRKWILWEKNNKGKSLDERIDTCSEQALYKFFSDSINQMNEESNVHLIKTEKLGRLLKGKYRRYFIKIYDDSKISGGYLLSLYKTLPQNGSDVDEWFDNYEELEKYFKNNDLEVEWLEE